jgi:hypothetical protein
MLRKILNIFLNNNNVKAEGPRHGMAFNFIGLTQ